MSHHPDAADTLLYSWLSLTSTLWNTRLVSSMPFNEAHIMGLLLRRSKPEKPLTATDLIRKTHLLKSQMNKVLSNLESKGFIVRMRSASDRRMAHILLTEQGKAAYLAEHEGVERILTQLIDRIGEERAMHIASELHTVTEQLDDILP